MVVVNSIDIIGLWLVISLMADIINVVTYTCYRIMNTVSEDWFNMVIASM